ncbi:MAG: hypothetical protein Q9168_008209 [Polycauliona sp. 1 TL-2023]
MPKGQKNIEWAKNDNDRKLLLAIVQAKALVPKYKEIAEAFGGGLPESCITTRFTQLRKEVRDKGVNATSTSSIPVNQRRSVNTASKAKTALANNDMSDDTEEEIQIKDDSDATVGGAPIRGKGTNKVIAGRVTKARKSPRQSSIARKDYGKMLDPYNDFGDVVDGDGDAIFDRQTLSSEDSMDSDKDFKYERGAVVASIEANPEQSEV